MQELKQVHLRDTQGKTISMVYVSDDNHIIKFTDGSFSHFGRYSDYGEDLTKDNVLKYEDIISEMRCHSDGSIILDATTRALCNMSIIDYTQLVEDAKAPIKVLMDAQEQRERKQYELLKKKFEVSDA